MFEQQTKPPVAVTAPSQKWPHRLRWLPPFTSNTVSLRYRIFLVVSLAMLTLLTVLYLPVRFFMLNSFARLERQASEEHVRRVLSALDDDIATLSSTTRDYAVWDDAYIAAQSGLSTEFVETNLTADTFLNNRLSLILLLNASGEPIFGLAFDNTLQQVGPLSPSLLSPMVIERLLSPTDEGSAGVVVTQDGPLMLAARPVLKSDGSGPAVGTLIMGRWIDEGEVNRFSTITHLPLNMLPIDALSVTDSADTVMNAIHSGRKIIVDVQSSEIISGYGVVQDLLGAVALVFRTDLPRTIYAEGQAGLFSFSLVLVVLVVGLSGIVLLLLELTVIRRLARLNSAVLAIESSHTVTQLPVDGTNDELDQLTTSINQMIAALERTQIERDRLHNERLGVKRQFIATTSHELRTPLTPIMGFIDVLMVNKSALDTDQQEALQIIRRNAERMSRLVDDLLKIAHDEINISDLSIQPTNLYSLIDETVALFQPLCQQKQLTLNCDIPANLPQVELDRHRIVQVLTNLLSNAVKYTLGGGMIQVLVQLRDRNLVEIQICDSGVGMTPDEQRRLFTPFFRADTPLRNSVEGSGLGLYIARSIIENHGGELFASSTYGVGSTFTIVLPVRHGL